MSRYLVSAVLVALALLVVFALFYVAGAALGVVFLAALPIALIGLGTYAWWRWGRRSARR